MELMFVLCLLVQAIAGMSCLQWTRTVKACIRGYNDHEVNSVGNVDACKQLCEDHSDFRCLSMEFSGGVCHLSRFTQSTISASADYEQPCNAWYYAERIESNDPECSNSWTEVRGACINNHNDRQVSNVASMAECQALCMNEGGFPCMSVDYNVDGTCLLSRSSQDTVTPSNAYKQPCTSTDYTYAERLDLGRWSPVVQACLRNHNDKIIESVADIGACQELCVMEPSFLCRSVDYKDNGRCQLSHDDRYTINPRADFTQPCYSEASRWKHSERFWVQ